MKRLIARWVIGRCADDGTPLPAWIQSLAERDPAVASYIRQSQQLVSRLKADAPAWTATAASTGRPPTKRLPPRHRPSMGSAAAVILSLSAVLLVMLIPPAGGPSPRRTETAVVVTAAEPDDVRVVQDFLKAQASLATRVWNTGSAAGGRLAKLEVPSLSAAQWFSDGVKQTGTATGSALGKTASLIHTGLSAEGERWQDAFRPLTQMLNRMMGAAPETGEEGQGQ